MWTVATSQIFATKPIPLWQRQRVGHQSMEITGTTLCLFKDSPRFTIQLNHILHHWLFIWRCDSPKKLFLSSIKYLRTKLPNPDFIIWSGDSSPHWHNDTSKHWDNVYNNLKIVRLIFERFSIKNKVILKWWKTVYI